MKFEHLWVLMFFGAAAAIFTAMYLAFGGCR